MVEHKYSTVKPLSFKKIKCTASRLEAALALSKNTNIITNFEILCC